MKKKVNDEKITQIIVGDVSLTTNCIKNCKKEIKNLLKDETIKNYLGFYQQKKISDSLGYIG